MSLWKRIYLERRAYALPLLVLLVGNVAALALGVFPLKRSVASAEQAEVTATNELKQASALERSAKDARDKKAQADQELTKFYKEILPVNAQDASQIANYWLQRTATASGLAVKNTQLVYEDVKDSDLLRVKGKATLNGDYTNIRRFLYAVETAQQFLIIEKVEVTQPTLLQSATGALEIQLDLATYFRSPAHRGVGGQ